MRTSAKRPVSLSLRLQLPWYVREKTFWWLSAAIAFCWLLGVPWLGVAVWQARRAWQSKKLLLRAMLALGLAMSLLFTLFYLAALLRGAYLRIG